MKPVPTTYFNILVVLEMLSALFSTLDIQITWIAQADEAAQTSNQETRIIEINPQPVLLILQNVLPILNNLMVVWGENEVIVKVSIQLIFVLHFVSVMEKQWVKV